MTVDTRVGKYIKVPVVNAGSDPVWVPRNRNIIRMEELPPQDWDSDPPTITAIEAPQEKIPESQKDLDELYQAVYPRLKLPEETLSPEQLKKVKTMIRECIRAFPRDSEYPGVSSKLPPMEIETDGPPIKSKPYKTTPEDREFLRKTINRLLESKCISPANSPWSFPVLVARHRSGKLRMCVNYKKLNAVTRKDSYPLPNIQDLLNNLGGNAYYSTLDLCQGFHQCPLSDKKDSLGHSSRDKSCMVTPFGSYVWNVVGFGMSNAPPHFSRCMDMVLSGLHWTTCCVFIDDLVIFSKSFDEHLNDLRTVLKRLEEYEVKVKPEKCSLFASSVQYLGHILSREGIEPIRARVEAITKIKPSRSLTELRSFLATCQYYRRFVKNFAKIAAPLYERLKKENLPFKSWEPGSKEDKAFETLKETLTSAPVLRLPNYEEPYFLSVDASKEGYGAVLEQEFLDETGKKRRHPVHFASRRTTPREARLESTHREASAVVWALHYFRYYIQGLPTTVFTDHGPLTWLMSTEFKNTPLAKYAARLQEWQRNVVIKYKPGRSHGNADGPSRLPVNMERDVLDADDVIIPDSYVGSLIRLAQDKTKPVWEQTYSEKLTDTDFLAEVRKGQKKERASRMIMEYLTKGEAPGARIEEIDTLKAASQQYLVKDGLLYRVTEMRRHAKAPLERVEQLYVPASCRERVLTALHEHPTAAHIGRSKMVSLLARRFYWPKYVEEVGEWVKTCPLCQRYKTVKPRNRGVLHPKGYVGPFHTLCVDIVSGFPTSQGYKYILTMVDTFTRWVHLVPLRNKEKDTIVDAIYYKIVLLHGCPRRILSDGGGEFENDIMNRLCERFGIRKRKTSPYHPQTNSQAERLHRHIPKTLAILAHAHPKDWPKYLPEVEFAYRCSPIGGVGFSPFEMIFGREPVLPVDVFTSSELSLRVDRRRYQLEHPIRMKEIWDMVGKISRANSAKQKEMQEALAKPVMYSVGQKVLLYRDPQVQGPRKLESPWNGPFKVLGLAGKSERTYKLEREDDGAEFLADVNDIVPYYSREIPPDEEKEEESPPREGGLIWTEGVGEPLYGELSRAEQKAIIKEAIQIINQLNPWVEVRKTGIRPISRERPYGAYAKRHIPKRKCLGIYKGEILDAEQYKERYPKDDAKYVFALKNGDYCDAVDPRKANFARFLNGIGPGETPNIEIIEEKGQLYVLTLRDVEVDEELRYDYGPEYAWDKGEPGILEKERNGSEDKQEEVGAQPRGEMQAAQEVEAEERKNPGTAQEESDVKRPEENQSPGRRLMNRESTRYSTNSLDLEDLEEDSMVVYRDPEAKDAPGGWSLGSVVGVDPEARVVELHRQGSYAYLRDPKQVTEATWVPRYVDVKDGKEVFTERPRVKHHKVLVYVAASRILAHNFYLTNKGRIPPPVLRVIQED